MKMKILLPKTCMNIDNMCISPAQNPRNRKKRPNLNKKGQPFGCFLAIE